MQRRDTRVEDKVWKVVVGRLRSLITGLKDGEYIIMYSGIGWKLY